jgi:hypothetical protein
MRNIIKGLVAASLVAGASVAATAPAQARPWGYGGYHGYHGGWHRGGVGAGTAVAAGILGLGVGAAIASDHRRYYDDGYYAAPPPPPAYGYGYGYYAAPPPPPPVYSYGYYGW